MTSSQKIFGKGYIPDKPSSADPVVSMDAMNMEPVADKTWDISVPHWVLNQEKLGTCTSNAVATAYRYELKRQNKPDFMASRLYLYYVVRYGKHMGKTADETPDFYNKLANQPPTTAEIKDSGSNIREAVKVLSCLGAIAEVDWPYTYQIGTSSNAKDLAPDCNAAVPPQNGCFQKAKNHFTVNYALTHDSLREPSSTVSSKDCWKMCIKKGYPIIFGYDWYDSFEAWTIRIRDHKDDGTFIAPVPNISVEKKNGGHAVLAVGWDDNVPNADGSTTGCFLIQNSWGVSWGKKGFFWMPYEWLTVPNLVNQFCITLMNSHD